MRPGPRMSIRPLSPRCPRPTDQHPRLPRPHRRRHWRRTLPPVGDERLGWLGLKLWEAPAGPARRSGSRQRAGASQSLCPSHPPLGPIMCDLTTRHTSKQSRQGVAPGPSHPPGSSQSFRLLGETALANSLTLYARRGPQRRTDEEGSKFSNTRTPQASATAATDELKAVQQKAATASGRIHNDNKPTLIAKASQATARRTFLTSRTSSEGWLSRCCACSSNSRLNSMSFANSCLKETNPQILMSGKNWMPELRDSYIALNVSLSKTSSLSRAAKTSRSRSANKVNRSANLSEGAIIPSYTKWTNAKITKMIKIVIIIIGRPYSRCYCRASA